MAKQKNTKTNQGFSEVAKLRPRPGLDLPPAPLRAFLVFDLFAPLLSDYHVDVSLNLLRVLSLYSRFELK